MIAAVIFRGEHGGILWIRERSGKIDDTIECPRFFYPTIARQAGGLALLRPAIETLEGKNRSAKAVAGSPEGLPFFSNPARGAWSSFRIGADIVMSIGAERWGPPAGVRIEGGSYGLVRR